MDPLKVVVEVINRKALADLQDEAAKLEKEIQKLSQEFNEAKISEQHFADHTEIHAKKLVGVRDNIRALNDELKETKQSGWGAGQGVMQLGYAVDDLQYGFGAIVNNLPQLAASFGLGAGLAGTIGITAVAVNQLYQHWDALQKALGNTAAMEVAKGALIEARREMEQNWGKKPGEEKEEVGLFSGDLKKRMYQDIEEMIPAWKRATEAAEEHQKALDKIADTLKTLSTIHGTNESKEAGLFKKAIEDAGGGDAVLKQMTDAAMTAAGSNDPEMRKKLQEHAAEILGEGLEGKNVDKALPQGMREHMEQLRNVEAGEKARATDAAAKQAHDKDTDEMRKRVMEEAKLRKELREKFKKDSEEERREWLHDVNQIHKDKRLDDIDEKKEAVRKQQQKFDDDMFDRRQKASEHGQIMQGARAATDYYQTGSSGDSLQALAKEARNQRNKTNDLLAELEKEAKKVRKLEIPR